MDCYESQTNMNDSIQSGKEDLLIDNKRTAETSIMYHMFVFLKTDKVQNMTFT